jgi:hypothetical protein
MITTDSLVTNMVDLMVATVIMMIAIDSLMNT